MKKLINDPRHVVRDMLEGLVDTTAHLALVEGENIVVPCDLPAPSERRVAVISGGGSGHEPAHAGYVGPGLLSAAVAGDVFTSPSVDAVLTAILATAGPAGALLVVKNYTGDRLNFGLAAELARERGIPVEIAVVADDVSLQGMVPTERRRGIAGTVLIHKVAGAAAAQGLPLGRIAALARRAASLVGSMGIGLTACTVPAAGAPGFTLGEAEIEFGLGIHGEKGVRRAQAQPADQIVDELLNHILADFAARNINTNQGVALLVNGLGGTPPMELQIVARHALAALRAHSITPLRAWVGNYMTALDMAGCSISVMPVDAELLTLLDAPASAPGWTAGSRLHATRQIVPGVQIHAPDVAALPPGPLTPTLARTARAVAQALIQAEAELTDLDSRAGDGDLGASMARGAEAIQTLPAQAHHTPEALLLSMGHALRRAIAGSSGPFYAIALTRAARALTGLADPTPAQWQHAFAQAVAAVAQTGGATPGDRTMLDALAPATQAWADALAAGQDGRAAFAVAVQAAEAGAQATTHMHPRLGRASYLGDRALGTPDGGAVAVTVWLRAIKSVLTQQSA